MTRTHEALESLARPLRRASDLAWAFAIMAAVVAGLAIAAWMLRLGVGAPALVALGVWLVVVVVAAVHRMDRTAGPPESRVRCRSRASSNRAVPRAGERSGRSSTPRQWNQ